MITVNAGANLQAALDAAPSGETLKLEDGATFLGNFIAPYKDGTAPIKLTGAATIRTPNSAPALRTQAGAHDWHFDGVSFAADQSQGDIVQLGTTTQTADAVPRGFVFERCNVYVERTAKRGFVLNAADVTLRDCSVMGVKLAGAESQAIAAWNGPGPFLIEDCYIDAGSIGVLFGGSAPSIPDLVPSDITFRRNRITRPLTMRGGGWAVKNLFELKNARRVTATGNILEHNWADAQSGWSIVFTVRAHGAPWSIVEDVLWEHNILRHCAMGFNVLGRDDTSPSQTMRNVVIRHNLLHDLDHVVWGGNGAALMVAGGPVNLHVERNTILQSGNAISAAGAPCVGFRYVGNIVRHNAYGIIGTGTGTGRGTIAQYFPESVVSGNVFGGGSPNAYPMANLFVTPEALMAAFEDAMAHNYRQVNWFNCGADIDAIEAAQHAPAPPPEPTLAEIIAEVAEGCAVTCAEVGGEVSPQDAARQAVTGMRDALLARLVP
jgi:hypothetical protein